MYEIRSAGVKGLGVFAKQLIPRGTRIFSERPLLIINHGGDGAGAGAVLGALGGLSSVQRKTLLDLSGGAPRHDVALLRWGQVAWYRILEALAGVKGRAQATRPESSSLDGTNLPDKPPGSRLKIKDYVRILAVFRSNAFDIGLDRQAIFPGISRINHSCLPSAEGNFHEGLGKLNVHATRDINDGEELMINYLKETGFALREQRQARLLESYGFDCDCTACDANSQRGKDGEKRKMEVLSSLAKYAQRHAVPGTAPQGLEAELAMMVMILELFEAEKLAGRALSS